MAERLDQRRHLGLGQRPFQLRLPFFHLGHQHVAQFGGHIGPLGVGQLATYGGQVAFDEVHQPSPFKISSTAAPSARHSVVSLPSTSAPAGESR